MGGHHSSLEGTLACDALPEIDVGSASRRNVGAFSSVSHASLPVAASVDATTNTFQSASSSQRPRRELRNSTTSLPGSAPAVDAAAAATKRLSHFFLFPGPSANSRGGGRGGSNEQPPPRGIVVVNPGPKASAASSLPRLDAAVAAAAAGNLAEGRLFAALSCGALDSGVNWESRELARIPRFAPILPPNKATTWMGGGGGGGGGGGKNAVRPSSPPSQSLIGPGDFQPLAEMINRYEEYFQNSTAPILQKQEELTCLQRKVEYDSRKVLQMMYDRQTGRAFASPAKLATDPTQARLPTERPRAAGSRQLDSISTGLADLHRLVANSTELLRKLTLDVRALQERVSTLADAPCTEESSLVK